VFLAFLLERELEYRLRQKKIEFSSERIKSALNLMKFSELEIEKEVYYLKSKHEPLASKIFATLKIKQPINLLSKEQVSDYLVQETIKHKYIILKYL